MPDVVWDHWNRKHVLADHPNADHPERGVHRADVEAVRANSANLTAADPRHPGFMHTLGQVEGRGYLYVSFRELPRGRYPVHARFVNAQFWRRFYGSPPRR